MEKTAKPTVGRIVHYFPEEQDQEAGQNNAEVCAAIVTQSFDNLTPNLHVMVNGYGDNGGAKSVIRFSVPHKNDFVPNPSNSAGYWDWPEVLMAKVEPPVQEPKKGSKKADEAAQTPPPPTGDDATTDEGEKA
jgi:hypothetical protein